jgi:hypothetical protein
VKWLGVLFLFVSYTISAESNLGVFSEIKANCTNANTSKVDCKIKVVINSITHPDYFEEVTHLVIVENKDCSKAVYNDILYFTRVEEGETYQITKSYSSDVETWFSACLFMEEEMVESLPVQVTGFRN